MGWDSQARMGCVCLPWEGAWRGRQTQPILAYMEGPLLFGTLVYSGCVVLFWGWNEVAPMSAFWLNPCPEAGMRSPLPADPRFSMVPGVCPAAKVFR